jgi:hypothetical protein
MGEYENPGLIPLVANLGSHNGLSPDSLLEGCEAVILSVLKTVCTELHSEKGRSVDAYTHLAETLLTQRQVVFRFFTLNHDLLLERYFRDSNLSYYDGFEPIEKAPSGRRFSFDEVKYRNAPVSLLKLHGSLH